MNYKYLGNSDLKVSTYCLGTMTFGETTSEEDGHYQLDESVASGINFIDTAEMYPTCPLRPETTGDTEIIVGNWITKNKSKRSSIVLATKVSGKGYMAVRNGEGINAKSVKIAIVDNAIATEHLDLNVFKKRDIADNDDNTTPPRTYNENQSWSHGTHCAGLATAEINNSTGIASIGGNVQLIAVKATGNSQDPGFTYYGYAGVQWACENGANVVSMSYGSQNSSNAMQELINSYPEVVYIAAAGNQSSGEQYFPAAYSNVIGVGSVDSNDLRSSFSNYNAGIPWIDISAPGGYSYGGLLSTVYSESLDGYAF